MTHVLFMAGIGNSEPGHWQSLWKITRPSCTWVEPTSWSNPVRDDWVRALVAAARYAKGPKVVVAHSLGCLTTAEAARELEEEDVCGAFLVAPPDAAGPAFPNCAQGYRRGTELRLPFPSRIIASENDPYCSVDFARVLASSWGSEFFSIGEKGHINLASNLGTWPEGRLLFEEFVERLTIQKR